MEGRKKEGRKERREGGRDGREGEKERRKSGREGRGKAERKERWEKEK
jgi:hypothetical protein